MLAAVLLALGALAFQPVTAATTAQPAHVFVRDASAPQQLDPRRAPSTTPASGRSGDNDPPSAQLTNAHGDLLRPRSPSGAPPTGTAELDPRPGGGTSVRAQFRGLIPMGRYSLFVRQLAGRAGVVLDAARHHGRGRHVLRRPRRERPRSWSTSPNPIPSGAQLVLIYHSDGTDHQSSPGNLGVTAHEQLITRASPMVASLRLPSL